MKQSTIFCIDCAYSSLDGKDNWEKPTFKCHKHEGNPYPTIPYESCKYAEKKSESLIFNHIDKKIIKSLKSEVLK